jgi:hypothetical protein
MITASLLILLFVANQNGGILTYEFLTVVALTIMVIVLAAVGAEPIMRMFRGLQPYPSRK